MPYQTTITHEGLGFLEKGMTGKMKKAVSLGVRNSLVLMERAHKDLFVLGKSKDRTTFDNKLVRRTGQLARSYGIAWRAGALTGSLGSPLKRAKPLEVGGTIRPKNAKFLTIPTEKVPQGLGARDIKGLVFIQSLKGQPLLVKPKGRRGDLDVFFILRKKVKIKGRQLMKQLADDTKLRMRIKDQMTKSMLKGIDDAG